MPLGRLPFVTVRRLSLTFALSVAVMGARPQITPPASWPRACHEPAGQTVVLAVPSSVFGQTIPTSVYLPPCYDWAPGALPVIYLLHGAGSDETQWPDLDLQPAADALIAQGAAPFIVVMPGGEYAANYDYETFLLSDLIPGVEGRLRVRRDPAGRAIGGISLGGYWALKTAFEHPDLFVAVGGHSPVVSRGRPDDPAELAQTADGLAGLSIALDVGSEDSLRISTEQLAGTLGRRGLNVGLTLGQGDHSRTYWRAHTRDYLRFYLSALERLGSAFPP